jgi:hypothetical protein
VLPTALRPEGSGNAAASLAGEIDALLADTAQDLGLSVDAAAGGAVEAAPVPEADLAARARARGLLVIAPSLELHGDEVELRLALAAPTTRALRVRVERVARDNVSARAAVMLRDLVRDLGGGKEAGHEGLSPPCGERRGSLLVTPARSDGRATLAAHATLYGGLVGYAIQRSSGSEDPRLLYPLLAVGAGIGLGGAVVIAEEWDVGVGDAWFLSSGAWWPTLAGHLIYEGRFAAYAEDPDQERWAYGLIGGTVGISLATLGLVLGDMSDGGAMLTHSGGGLGLVLGGLTEWALTGDVNRTPAAGLGYGAALGWLASAAAARQLQVTTSRVLAIDLGALLGGLGGAAIGSPLVFESPTEDQQRAWVGLTAGGFLLGAGAAWFVTRGGPTGGRAVGEAWPSWIRLGNPMIGVVGESVVGSRRAPALGLGWQGAIP